MSDIPNYTDLANYRYRSFTNTEVPKLIGYGANPTEDRTIPSSAPYTFLLHETPQFNVPSTTHIFDASQGGMELEEVSKTTTPANNQYRVNYDERGNGEVEFNAAQKGHSVNCKYYGLGSLNKIETLQAVVSAITSIQVLTYATDTILSDNQTAGKLALELDCRDSNVTITLPDASLNEGLQISVNQLYKGGRGIINGKGADTIAGYSEIYIDDQGNGGLIYSNGVEWKIQGDWKHTIKFFDDFRGNNDWTNRELGSIDINYDNLAGNFIVGETIVEAISGYEAVVMSDDGAVLKVKNADGNFTNNREITGQTSGASADVNEGTGSTKNVDSDIYHGTGQNLVMIDLWLIISEDGTHDNSFFQQGFNQTGERGSAVWQTDSNSLEPQTGTSGLYICDRTGNLISLDTQDWVYAYKFKVRY